MKLNFWQWLGVTLLVLGLALYIYQKRDKTPANMNPTTQSTR